MLDFYYRTFIWYALGILTLIWMRMLKHLLHFQKNWSRN